LRPGAIDEETRLEIIRTFCERNPHITAQNPREILALLCKPLFKSSIQLKRCFLSSLTVRLSFREKHTNYFEDWEIASCLSVVSLDYLFLAANFTLKLRIAGATPTVWYGR
jgi:hypothetical protein